MTRDEHDRKRAARIDESPLQLESVDTRHRDIEHEATGRVTIVLAQERVG